MYFVYGSKIKMEGGSVEAGGENHLENVLSQTEIANIPNPIAVKINNYIDQKFGEYLTSKALHETSKSQIGKYPVFSATHSKLSSRILSFLQLLHKLHMASHRFKDFNLEAALCGAVRGLDTFVIFCLVL